MYCSYIFPWFEWKNKQAIHIPICWINHKVYIVVFQLCCCFIPIFVTRNCSFKSLLSVSQKLDVIVYRQGGYRDRKFGTIFWTVALVVCLDRTHPVGGLQLNYELLQAFLIFQKLHNLSNMTNQALFHK